ncbi:MAG: glycoside hydrolase family 2 TIM barrel-domain containing protein, partial [Lachnospiraceae bacterium]
LRGVSRHQDRWGIGNALLPEHHEEDMDLICELGANTIRLAHYQHDQYFYDLCDEKGMVVWAEIPYISRHMPGGWENTISQMTELITQNYNHASIVCWGLSNEITMSGAATEEVKENHRVLNDLCHSMDRTRFTTMACMTTTSIKDPYLSIPDVISYNHYFGWYGGETDMNGPWMDDFHKTNPTIAIGMSEYGCEGLNWHNSNPQAGDYTEEYQAYYHEELIKQLFPRKYIWATHVWNMFDFGCDNRNEGGENGQNHKGLVTIDRKYKKDAFYAYKAWLSDEPFVHICGKRYVDRVEDVTKVTVYSNQPSVELFANGISLGIQTCPEHFFYYRVPNAGVTRLEVVAGVACEGEAAADNCPGGVASEGKVRVKATTEACLDHSEIHKVEEFNENYRLKEAGAILNWCDVTMPEGYFSINDKIGDITSTFRGKIVFGSFLLKLIRQMKGKGGKSTRAMDGSGAG